ncbi:ThiF family adenylyltransferase [Legionella norrlandica]|nr:ThiF family adenylyltransferase [Legionella norrlandica]
MNKLNLTTEESVRYSQHIKLEEIGLVGQKKLKNARVLCIGLGGLGSPLLLYLAAAGIGGLGIVDDDIVELSNLQRQILYNRSHIKQKKTTIAKAQLLALNPSLQVNSYSKRLTEKNAAELISQYDIIADGSDNFHTRYLIHHMCFQLEKPYVYASASQFQGYCSIFHGKQEPCFHCLFPASTTNRNIANCEAGGVLGTLPGLLGIIQATEIIKWILQIGNPLNRRLLVVDLLKMAFKEITLTKNADCEYCVHHHPLKELIYPVNCHSQIDSKHYSITLDELNQLFQKNTSIHLIDVRTAKEHEIQNIGGKILPLEELPHRLDELNPMQPIVLYCQSGKRSQIALRLLLEAGFTSVKYVVNGLTEM